MESCLQIHVRLKAKLQNAAIEKKNIIVIRSAHLRISPFSGILQNKTKLILNVFARLPGLAGHRSHGFPHAFPMVAQQVSRVHTTP